MGVNIDLMSIKTAVACRLHHQQCMQRTSGISCIFSGNLGASGPCPLVGLYSAVFRDASPRSLVDALDIVLAALEADCPMAEILCMMECGIDANNRSRLKRNHIFVMKWHIDIASYYYAT